MASVSEINGAIGTARGDVFTQMENTINDKNEDIGAKTTALMNGQAALGITDGVQNLLAKAYNRWQQTGQ